MVTHAVLMNTVLRCAYFANRAFLCALFTESFKMAELILSNDRVFGDG